MNGRLAAAIKASPAFKFGVLTAILLSHLVPSLVIGFGFVIPGSCIEGLNEYTIGYLTCLAGFILTFVSGVTAAWQFGRLDRVGSAAALPAE